MDSVRKRKAPPTTPSAEPSATKKIRLLNTNHSSATQDKTQAVGQRLIDQLRRATDKTGRLIATEFESLPERSDFPDYYQLIKLPIAVETIAAKVKRNVYSDISAIESDFKRMIQNAKEYNAPKSEVYEDAERIRKLVSNFMRSNNPAYERDPNYQAAPTPIPGDEEALPAVSAVPNRTPTVTRGESRSAQRTSLRRMSEATPVRKASQTKIRISRAKREESEEPDPPSPEPVKKHVPVPKTRMHFKGKSFQAAQEALLSELIGYLDAEGLEIYTPFVMLPSRKLEDYYRLIRHPVSLQGLLKRARGVQGRNPPTGVSEFKTWEQLEDEVSYVWRNAQEYNEDESEMYQLADEFKEHFEMLLADAKAAVEPPMPPKIKLGGPKPKVTLNLSSHRASPSPSTSADNEAIRVQAAPPVSTNGIKDSPAPVVKPPENVVRPSTSDNNVDAPKAAAVNGTTPRPTAVKTESAGPPSSSTPAAPVTNGVAPAATPRPASSNVPLPPPTAAPPQVPQPPIIQLPPAPTRHYPRGEAFLPSVTIATHPQLKISQPFSVQISPHPTLTHQSTTVTLPATHYFVQISPTISTALSMGRPYKMFVTLNGTRLNQRDTIFHADFGRRTHVYEGSLASGVNRIEVEIAAAKREANGEASSTGLDVEKVTVFASLMR